TETAPPLDKLDARLQHLAEQASALEQPPRFAVVLGANPQVPEERRRAILAKVTVARPRDLAVLMALGATYPRIYSQDAAEAALGRYNAGERARWYQAAVAAHPRNVAAWHRLHSCTQRRQWTGRLRSGLMTVLPNDSSDDSRPGLPA